MPIPPRRLPRAEFEARKELGQAFKRLWAQPEWERTVAGWVKSQLEAPLLIDAGACPPDRLVERYWQLSGKKEFALELLGQMNRWLKDAELDPALIDDGPQAEKPQP